MIMQYYTDRDRLGYEYEYGILVVVVVWAGATVAHPSNHITQQRGKLQQKSKLGMCASARL